MNAPRFLVLLLLLLMTALPLAAANNPNSARGFSADGVYQMGTIDNVNLFNGSVAIAIPLGSPYTAGDRLKYGFTLNYNSSLWEYERRVTNANPSIRTETVPARNANAGFGWILTLGELFFSPLGRFVYVGPDGGEHAFVQKLHFESETVTPGVFYANDGSYLRLRTVGNSMVVDSPDGVSRWFECAYACSVQPGNFKRYHLKRIADTFGNEVTIERDEEPEAGNLWQWRIREQTEAGLTTEHRLTFARWAGGEPYRWIVHELDLQVGPATFTSGQPVTQSRRAVYTFAYANFLDEESHVYRPPENTCPPSHMTAQAGHEPMRVPMLQSVTLPDGSKWQFRYVQHPLNPNPPPNQNGRPPGDNRLETLLYPTGGGIKYAWTTYFYPRRACFHPQDRDPIPRAAVSSGLKTRQLINPDGSPNGAPWRYFQNATGAPPVTPGEPQICLGYDTFLNAVVDPLANITVNYFTAVVNTGHNGNPRDYGLPFSSTDTDPTEGNLRLSTQVFQCPSVDLLNPDIVGPYEAVGNAFQPHPSCIVRRKTYVRYESSGQNCDWSNEDNGPGCVSANRRLAAEKTIHVDDGNTWTLVENSDFDGLGHYRKTVRSGNFFAKNAFGIARPHGDQKISRTTYNPSVNFNLSGQFCCAPATWLLDTYNEISEEEPAAAGDPVAKGGVARTEYLFDERGFLKQKRTRGGAGRTGTDLITTYDRIDDSAGRIRNVESFYGGDGEFLPTGDLPITALGTPDYIIAHTYRFGTLEKSEYRSCDGASSVLLIQQNEIDPSTGLVMSTRDATGATTTFKYDTMNRLIESKPPDEARTEYVYTPAVTGGAFSPATVTATRHTTGATKPQTAWTYDPFGRVAVVSTRLPDLDGNGNRWSRAETEYYPNGWVLSETTAGVAGEANSGKTRYTKYDPFGRVLTKFHADSSGEDRKTTYVYEGVRTAATTTTDAATSSTQFRTKQYFDAQGRLSVVEENIGGTPRTFYEHDSSNRLVKVLAGNQTRTFEYDNRGFLRNEKHPELGANGISYGNYDARGHYREICHGASACTGTGSRHPLDMSMTYDLAERLTLVLQPGRIINGDPAPLKSFAYYGQGNQRGLLKRATRHNYIYEPRAVDRELAVAVTEDFQYWPTRRLKRSVVSAPGVRMQSTFYYDDLGNLSATDYPQLTINCEPGSNCPAEGPTRSVQNKYMYGLLREVPGIIQNIDYHGNLLPARVKHANNVTWIQEITNHNLPRPDRIRVVRGGGANVWNSGYYQYDGAGFISRIDSDSFTYDEAGRLVRAAMSGGAGTQNFQYDRFGNHAPFPGSQLSVDSSTNRLPASAGIYDVGGNLRSFRDPRQNLTAYHYEYDPFNMIRRVKVMENGGLAVGRMFLYDASDERVATIEYAPAPSQVRETWSARDAASRVIRDFERVYDVEDAPGTTPLSRGWKWSRDYVFRDAVLAATIDLAGTRHMHVDHLGTPRVSTDGSGQPSAVRIFRPFGEEMVSTGDASRLKFTGHERDAMTGDRPYGTLDYMHARYYNPYLGKFLSIDPGRDIDPRNPQSWNLYAYVRNNPIGASDPDGRKPVGNLREYGVDTPGSERCTANGGCVAQAMNEREVKAKADADEARRQKKMQMEADKAKGGMNPSGQAEPEKQPYRDPRTGQPIDTSNLEDGFEDVANGIAGFTDAFGIADVDQQGAAHQIGVRVDGEAERNRKEGLIDRNGTAYAVGYVVGVAADIVFFRAFSGKGGSPAPPGPAPVRPNPIPASPWKIVPGPF